MSPELELCPPPLPGQQDGELYEICRQSGPETTMRPQPLSVVSKVRASEPVLERSSQPITRPGEYRLGDCPLVVFHLLQVKRRKSAHVALPSVAACVVAQTE